MLEVSELIYSFLKDNAVIAAVTTARVFPVVAPEDTDKPFVAYTILNQEPETLDGEDYEILIRLFFDADQYTECVTFADAVKTEIKNTRHLNWRNSAVDYINEDQSYVANITININK